MTLDEIIAELHSRAVDDGAFEHDVIRELRRLGGEVAELRVQRDAGLFAACRLYTDELGRLRELRRQVEEFDERWLEGDMGGDEVLERLKAMRA